METVAQQFLQSVETDPMSSLRSATGQHGVDSKIALALPSGNHEYPSDGASGYVRYFGGVAGDPKKAYYNMTSLRGTLLF